MPIEHVVHVQPIWAKNHDPYSNARYTLKEMQNFPGISFFVGIRTDLMTGATHSSKGMLARVLMAHT